MTLNAALKCKRLLPAFRAPSRGKKYYITWGNPFSLNDYDNLSKGYPTVPDIWDKEWENSEIVPHELKAFDITRLPRFLDARNKRKALPIKYDHEKRPDYKRRLFGIYGLSSGVNPCELFDSKEVLEREKEIRRRLEPDIEEFKRNRAEELAEQKKIEEERIRKIQENLERLPEMIEKYRSAQERKAMASRVQEEKRRQLLEDARDRFGYYVDHRDPKFLKLVEERQEEEKLEKKASKKKQK